MKPSNLELWKKLIGTQQPLIRQYFSDTFSIDIRLGLKKYDLMHYKTRDN